MELDALLPARVLFLRWFLWPALMLTAVWAAGALAFWLLARAGGGLGGESWSERARRAWVPRRAPLLGLIAGGTLTFWLWTAAHDVGAPVPALLWVACALGAYGGFLLLGLDVRRRLGLATSAGRAVRSHLVILCLFAPLLVMVWAWSGARGGPAPQRFPYLGLAFLALLAGLAGAGIVLARALGLARPASARVQRIVASAHARIGVRAVWSVALDQSNAFALPALGILAVTPACEAVLDDDELEAVCLHELGHLSESRAFLLLRFAPALCFLGLLVSLPLSSWWSALVLLGSLWPLHAAGRALSRWAERRADAFASARASDARTLARALLHLHEANLVPAVLHRRATHPDLYERVLAAGLPPPFARPAPPPREGLAPLLIFVALGVLGFLGWFGLDQLAQRSDRGAQLFALALVGPHASALGQLGILEHDGDAEREHALFLAAARLEPSNPWWLADAALASLRAGKQADAVRELRAAEELAPRPDEPLQDLLDSVRQAIDVRMRALAPGQQP